MMRIVPCLAIKLLKLGLCRLWRHSGCFIHKRQHIAGVYFNIWYFPISPIVSWCFFIMTSIYRNFNGENIYSGLLLCSIVKISNYAFHRLAWKPTSPISSPPWSRQRDNINANLICCHRNAARRRRAWWGVLITAWHCFMRYIVNSILDCVRYDRCDAFRNNCGSRESCCRYLCWSCVAIVIIMPVTLRATRWQMAAHWYAMLHSLQFQMLSGSRFSSPPHHYRSLIKPRPASPHAPAISVLCRDEICLRRSSLSLIRYQYIDKSSRMKILTGI